jgi:hypothetical protein
VKRWLQASRATAGMSLPMMLLCPRPFSPSFQAAWTLGQLERVTMEPMIHALLLSAVGRDDLPSACLVWGDSEDETLC